MAALLTLGRGPRRPDAGIRHVEERMRIHAAGGKPPVLNGLWALPRPRTSGWGSGAVFERVSRTFGEPDVAFGVRDNIPAHVLGVDLQPQRSTDLQADWRALPFLDESVGLGFWDPPYTGMFAGEAREIWRCCRQLAILAEHVYPTSWFRGGYRQAHIAVSMGPFRRMRALQVFGRDYLRPQQSQLDALNEEAGA